VKNRHRIDIAGGLEPIDQIGKSLIGRPGFIAQGAVVPELGTRHVGNIQIVDVQGSLSVILPDLFIQNIQVVLVKNILAGSQQGQCQYKDQTFI